jgi:DNA-binding transcriptional MerR regulator
LRNQPRQALTEPGTAILSIGDAAARLGVSERALRYYQELGLVTPSGQTPGGMRRYSEEDLARVARIRELQKLLGLNLDEVAAVLRNDDRLAQIRQAYHDRHTSAEERSRLCREYVELQEELRATVEAKQAALASLLADIDARIDKARSLLGPPPAT